MYERTASILEIIEALICDLVERGALSQTDVLAIAASAQEIREQPHDAPPQHENNGNRCAQKQLRGDG